MALIAYQGERIVLRIEVNTQAGTDKDLTGCTVILRIGDIRGETTVYQKTGEIVDGPTGYLQAIITPAESAEIPVRMHDYQFIVTDSSGAVQMVREDELDMRYTLQAP